MEMNVERGKPGTFSEQAIIFNELPKNIRLINNYSKFCKEAKTYFRDKALARTLSF